VRKGFTLAAVVLVSVRFFRVGIGLEKRVDGGKSVDEMCAGKSRTEYNPYSIKNWTHLDNVWDDQSACQGRRTHHLNV